MQKEFPFSPLEVVALFAGFWVLVSLLIAQGGWRQMAALFPATEEPEGRRLVAGARIEPYLANYTSCLNVILTPAGVYLAVQFPFFLGHRPMLIPWSGVNGISERAGWLGGRRFEVAIAARHFVMTLRLPEEAESLLRKYAPQFFARREGTPRME